MEQLNRSRLLIYIALFALVVAVFVGIVRGRQSSPEKAGEEFKYQEPTITLYDHKTGEKKKIRFEDYIAGVVAAEMAPTWPREALAAQAIIARTFTLHKIKYEGGVPQHGADASTDTEEFQAYDPGRINDNVRAAVEMTRGKVIRYNGKYVRAWFHANAGGKTATPAEGLGFTKEPTPYIKSVADPGQEIAPPEERNWAASFPVGGVRKAVSRETGQDPGEFTSAAIVERGPSGRATKIRLGSTVVSGPALRLALGTEAMRSTLLDRLEVRDGALVVSGRGHGHGVGMSQWGAYYFAREGKSPEEIIKYYYSGVTVDKIWR
ncbi:MAG: Sporulation stage II protein D [Thermoanaerobacterales bacterium 50_218]|nr:MAG: Sporulation stage II protein D [Thermoanaerobacterales bacterium 50_218]